MTPSTAVAALTPTPAPTPIGSSIPQPNRAPRTQAVVMGVVNVTPDSFSDGGEWFSPKTAIAHGLELLESGADIVDVGGESTRPGAPRVSIQEELDRVLPVIAELSSRGATVSIDTTRAVVAEQALAAGARLINDVSGGLADPEMPHLVADAGVAYVVMHWRGHSAVMESFTSYSDVVLDVRKELSERVDVLLSAGAREGQLILDPGLGFAKSGESNWPLLARLNELESLGFPVLVGASRKRFLGHLLAGPDAEPVPPLERDHATQAITTLALNSGAWGVRVHDVVPAVAAVKVVQAWQSASNFCTNVSLQGEL